MNNPFQGIGIEFHILQSFPVTCLNRDDVGAPKSAVVGGVPRARVSSQCWKRQVRLALRELGVKTAIRTKRLSELLRAACLDKGADAEQADVCAAVMAGALTKDTLLFISPNEIERLAAYAAEAGFDLPVENKKKKGQNDEGATGELPKAELAKLRHCLSFAQSAAEGLDMALFGRMVAQEPGLNVHAAASFAHALSTHKVSNEIEFFTALDDLQDEPGSAHMGSLEFNSATYYRYVSLDLGQLWDNIGGEDLATAVTAFVKALYIAVPAARQATQSGACPWEYARVLVRRGQRMQAAFDKPVRAREGFLQPSVEALDNALIRHEKLAGSLYGKLAAHTFGADLEFSIDDLAEALAAFVRQQGVAA